MTLSSLRVTEQEIDDAFAEVPADFLRILRLAAENIRRFHEKQKRNSFILNDQPSIVDLHKKDWVITPVGECTWGDIEDWDDDSWI